VVSNDTPLDWLDQSLTTVATTSTTVVVVVVVEQSPLAMSDTQRATTLRTLFSRHSNDIDLLLFGATRQRGDTLSLFTDDEEDDNVLVGFESHAAPRRYDMRCFRNDNCSVYDFAQFTTTTTTTTTPTTTYYWHYSARAILEIHALNDENEWQWSDVPQRIVDGRISPLSLSKRIIIGGKEKIARHSSSSLSHSSATSLFPIDQQQSSLIADIANNLQSLDIACGLIYTRQYVSICSKLLQQRATFDKLPRQQSLLSSFVVRNEPTHLALCVAAYPSSLHSSIQFK
jgi:hypothetical protein